MLSCHVCLLISRDCLVFWVLSFDCSICLIAWYLHFLLYLNIFNYDIETHYLAYGLFLEHLLIL